MAVQAMTPGYTGEDKDRPELFHGNQLVYVGWDHHTMVCAPLAFPLPPSMPFGDLVEKVLPTTAYASDPDWGKIDWSTVQWIKTTEPFTPDPAKSLAENGLGHKSLLRFRTPGLNSLRPFAA